MTNSRHDTETHAKHRNINIANHLSVQLSQNGGTHFYKLLLKINQKIHPFFTLPVEASRRNKTPAISPKCTFSHQVAEAACILCRAYFLLTDVPSSEKLFVGHC